MKRLLLRFCAVVAVLAGTAVAQQGSPLRVTLSFDQPKYALTGEAVIEVLVKNTSRHSIFIYSDLAWGESASLSIWFKDATTGKGVEEDHFIHDSVTPPPTSKDDFVKILPGHIYGVSIRSSIAQLNIRKQGTYEVVADYHSPIPHSYSFGLPIWSREDGTIASNPLTIKIED